jgi:predicted ATPase
MRFYVIDPNELRPSRPISDPDDFLRRDGSNAAAIYRKLYNEKSSTFNRISDLATKIATGTRYVSFGRLGEAGTFEHGSSPPEPSKRVLLFCQEMGQDNEQVFSAHHMSDGTLRSLGCLLAVYQPGKHSVIAIEEPEATIHPAASEVLVQAFMDASHDRQILISTHSADMLDIKDIKAEQIRVFDLVNGRTVISPVDESGKGLIRDRLFMPGELMRMDELQGSGGEVEDFDIFADAMPETGTSS